MSNTELLIKLRELHADLLQINDEPKFVGQVDDETIEALGELVTGVSEIVDQAKESTFSDFETAGHSDVLDRIRQFESQHPRVKRFLSQLTDLLVMIGI